VVYAVQLAAEIWVDLALRSIRVRLKSLKEMVSRWRHRRSG
jgi:hypothetical protein